MLSELFSLGSVKKKKNKRTPCCLMLLLTSEVNDGELLPSLEALKHK